MNTTDTDQAREGGLGAHVTEKHSGISVEINTRKDVSTLSLGVITILCQREATG